MKYYLNNNVFIAYGSTNACIYDLRDTVAKLYKLDRNASAYFQSLTTIENSVIDDEKKLMLSKLLELSLITENQSDLVTLNPLNSNVNARSAWIELTDKCQLKCTYCYGEFDSKKTNKLDANKIDLLIEQLFSNNFCTFKIIGGEPLLYRHLTQVLKRFL